MGRDKATLELDGVPLWRRQCDVLRAAGAAEIFLSARADQPWTADAVAGGFFNALVSDAAPGGGPLAGVAAALARAAHPHLAVLAVDLPRMDAAWFTTLRAECAPGLGAVGKRGEFFEPLAAIYPKNLMMTAGEMLGRGEFSLQRLIASAVAEGKMRVREITPAETPQFENWNEPRI